MLKNETDLGEIHEIAEATSPIQGDVLAGVLGNVQVCCFGTRELYKGAALTNEHVTGRHRNCCLLDRCVVDEEELTVATGTKVGDGAKGGVGVVSDGR